jgi:hypothetical protein
MASMLLRQLLKQLGIRRVRHEHLMNEAIKPGLSANPENY